MVKSITITDAKARLSEVINKVSIMKEKIYISRKGKNIAAIVPIEEIETGKKEGLIHAKGVLGDINEEIDDMVDSIYMERTMETSREVEL